MTIGMRKSRSYERKPPNQYSTMVNRKQCEQKYLTWRELEANRG